MEPLRLLRQRLLRRQRLTNLRRLALGARRAHLAVLAAGVSRAATLEAEVLVPAVLADARGLLEAAFALAGVLPHPVRAKRSTAAIIAALAHRLLLHRLRADAPARTLLAEAASVAHAMGARVERSAAQPRREAWATADASHVLRGALKG